MPKGQSKKNHQKRISFIHNEFEKRISQLPSFRTDTLEECKKTIQMLKENIKLPSGHTINFSDCLPSSHHYKRAMPKGYMKKIKELEEILKKHEQKKAEEELKIKKETQARIKSEQISRLGLHEVPLFENTQLIDWAKDEHTNQLNRLVVALNRDDIDGQDYVLIDRVFDNLEYFWKQAHLPLPTNEGKEQFHLKYWPLVKKAIYKCAEIDHLNVNDYNLKNKESKFRAFTESLLQKTESSTKTTRSFTESPLLITESSKTKIDNSSKASGPTARNTPSIQYGDLERITDSFDTLERAQMKNIEKKELTKKAALLNLQSPAAAILVKRLFIGCGYMGMTVMSTDPLLPMSSSKAFKQLQEYLALNEMDRTEILQLDTLLISEYDTGHWTKAEHRAEQEHPLLEIPGSANASDFIPKSQSMGRTFRANTKHLFYANQVNMGLKDTPPPLFGVKAEVIEKQLNHKDKWDKNAVSYDFRVKVAVTSGNSVIYSYIYAQSIEMSLGMGIGQLTSFEDALLYEHSKTSKDKVSKSELLAKHTTYDCQKGYTPIIHGNDFDLSNKERQLINERKTKRVVIIGGAGGAATAYRMAVFGTDKYGYRLKNERGEFIKDSSKVSLNPNVKIFARAKVRYDNIAIQALESFEFAKEKNNLFEGYLLIGIRFNAKGEIILRFHVKQNEKEIDERTALEMKKTMANIEIVEDGPETNKKYYILNLHEEVCDQLISGMGQDASIIRKLVNEFEKDKFVITRGADGHTVGLHSDNGLIRFHGATANFITTAFAEDFAESHRRSNLPRNSNDPNIMPAVLPKLFSFFSSRLEHARRISFNVNTCFLQRGDLRDDPTEFHNFLTNAGLIEPEIVSFVKFLKDQRASDKTGAGVSWENLNHYIKTSGIYDRIAVCSSCVIMAINDLSICSNYGSVI
jgi:hypothetical protein